jgi:hypothetical protein
MAVPESSLRASAGVPIRFPQMLEPTDRTLFPPCCKCLSVGPRQWTRRSSLEELQERECSCRGFLAECYQRVWYMSQPASVMFQLASVTHARLIPFAFGASQEV